MASDSDAWLTFPSTAWSCIRVAENRDHPQCVEATNRLITLYWKPVFSYLRAKGNDFQSAQDLTQEFFAWFLEKDKVEQVDPKRGRFRTFLRTLLNRFLIDRGPRARNQVQFERQFVSIGSLARDEDRDWEPTDGQTPEETFDRQYALVVWATVQEQLQQRNEEAGRGHWYEMFLAYHAPEGKRPSQEALAERYGLSLLEAKEILKRMKNQCERLLRAEVRADALNDKEIEEELRQIRHHLIE